MLKTRIITAVLLLAVLLPVLYLDNFPAFGVIATLFFGAAMWESTRLFGQPVPLLYALVWAALFARGVFGGGFGLPAAWFALCCLLWLLRFVPALALGLPPLAVQPARRRFSNTLLAAAFAIALLGCFIAIVTLFRESPLYLLSVLALVWIADIGAYFSGKAFGRHKLAPSISPGKSWEGAIGGAVAVLLLAALAILCAPAAPWLQDTFAVRLQARFGWAAALAVLLLLVAASVAGDLFESMLKRRAGLKDSSALLPGHGGVLDRIDALVPVLPLAALIGVWL